jgi:hypothetical protein
MMVRRREGGRVRTVMARTVRKDKEDARDNAVEASDTHVGSYGVLRPINWLDHDHAL